MKLAIAAVTAALLSGPAFAQSSSAPAQQPAAAAKTVAGAGEVKAVDAKSGSITLHHGPIAALGWPAMTMKFKATADVLRAVKPGQAVTFTLDPATNQVLSVKPR